MGKRESRYFLIVLFVSFFLIGFILSITLDYNKKQEINKAGLVIVGVDENGIGKASLLLTEKRAGSGLVLVNIGDILADYETQYSARVAAKVASNYTSRKLDSWDIIYNIESNASVVGGSSAGSAMAVATISLLENKELNGSVAITGSLNEDGTLGSASGIKQKANAARGEGVKLLLVPKGSDYDVISYIDERKCESMDSVEYCEIKRSERSNLGIELKEVETIKDALQYFLI